MKYVAVTVQLPFLNLNLDLDLPWQMPVPLFLQDALPAIVRQKGYTWRVPQGYMPRLAKYILNRKVPILTHTFRGAGVYDGHILLLEFVPRPPWHDPYRFFLQEVLETQLADNPEGAVHERIYLMQERIRLGRHNLRAGYVTDVDLSVFPAGRHISRRHALIRWQRGHFYLYDRGSRNHTYLNKQRLTPKQPYRLKPGDHISFANRIHFIFYDAQRQLQAQMTETPIIASKAADRR